MKFIVTILNKSNVHRTNLIHSKIKTIYQLGKTQKPKGSNLAKHLLKNKHYIVNIKDNLK